MIDETIPRGLPLPSADDIAVARVITTPAPVFKAPVGEFDTTWCCYLHHQGDSVVFVGISKLKDVFTFVDARRNTIWRKLFASSVEQLTISIVYQTISQRDCQHMHKLLFKYYRPIANVKGYNGLTKTPVICDQTGERFDSISAAALAKGVSQSQLNNHINRKPGFNSVRGLVFRRANEDE